MMKLEGQKMGLEGDRIATEAKVMQSQIDLQIKELSLAVAEADASAKIAAIVSGGTGMVDPAKMEAPEQAVAMLASHMGERELQEMGDGYLPDPEPEPVEEPKPQGDPNLMKMLESMTAGQDALAKAMLKPKRVSMTRQPDGSLTGRAEVDEPVIAPEQLPVQPVQP